MAVLPDRGAADAEEAMGERERSGRRARSTALAAATLLLAFTLASAGCGSADDPPADALSSASLDPAWNAPIAATTTSVQSLPETGDLRLGVVLLNASVDTTLRLGAVTIFDGAGIEVDRIGLEPVAEREEPAIAFPEESPGVVDSLVLPPQHLVALRAELRPDCDAEAANAPDLPVTATDGETRTEVRLGDLASAGGPGWVADAVAQHCAAS